MNATADASSNTAHTTSSENSPSISRPTIGSPELIRPHLKAQPRKPSNRGRPKERSRILTDTPEKQAIEEKEKEKRNTNDVSAKQKKQPAKRKMQPESSDTDKENESLSKESDCDFLSEIQQMDEKIQLEKQEIEGSDFILVKLHCKKSVKHYVAQVDGIQDDVFKIKYLKKLGKS